MRCGITYYSKNVPKLQQILLPSLYTLMMEAARFSEKSGLHIPVDIRRQIHVQIKKA
jgi:hypothetical protein